MGAFAQYQKRGARKAQRDQLEKKSGVAACERERLHEQPTPFFTNTEGAQKSKQAMSAFKACMIVEFSQMLSEILQIFNISE